MRKILFISLGILLAFAVQAQASLLDLSNLGDWGTLNSGLFYRTDIHGQGSGNLDAFVRIQAKGQSTTDEGYNTDGTPQFDTKGGSHTHSLLLSDVPLVDISGTQYREFLLDTAEPGPKGSAANAITMDKMEIYLLSIADFDGTAFSSADLKFSLGNDVTGSPNTILLNNVTGNGVADMYAYVPDVNFTGTNSYVYLYSGFSQVHGSFEEWGVRDGKPVIPEPLTAILFGTGLVGALVQKKFSA